MRTCLLHASLFGPFDCKPRTASPVASPRPTTCTFCTIVGEIACKEGCAVHADVLMTSHAHRLITPREPGRIARTLQALARRCVRDINTRYHRTGTLWEGRYKVRLVSDDRDLLQCHRYIERNPLRAAGGGPCRRPLVQPSAPCLGRAGSTDHAPPCGSGARPRQRHAQTARSRAGHGTGDTGRNPRTPTASAAPARLRAQRVPPSHRRTRKASGGAKENRQTNQDRLDSGHRTGTSTVTPAFPAACHHPG